MDKEKSANFVIKKRKYRVSSSSLKKEMGGHKIQSKTLNLQVIQSSTLKLKLPALNGKALIILIIHKIHKSKHAPSSFQASLEKIPYWTELM